MLSFESADFVSPRDGRGYRIHQGSRLRPSSETLQKITAICNQEDVHKLFTSFKGRAYTEQDAFQFLEFIAKGWAEGAHFVFLVTTREGDVAAALDVKSNSRDAAEIGYWCDQSHRGIMSTAVTIMMDWAKSQGYLSLFATPINEQSSRLLARVGFVRTESSENAFGFWRRDLSIDRI